MNNKCISVLLLLLIIVLTTTLIGCSQSSTSERNNIDVATESDASYLLEYPVTDWRSHNVWFVISTVDMKVVAGREIKAPGNARVFFGNFTPTAIEQFQKEYETILDDLSINYVSNDESIAVVKDGMIKGLKEGKTTIHFIVSHPDVRNGEPVIEAFEVVVERTLLSNMNVGVAESKQITIPSDAAISSYKSGNNDIATVNAQGIVTGVAQGEVDIYIIVEEEARVVRVSVY